STRGWMKQDVHVRAFHGADQTSRHFFPGLLKIGMDSGSHKIELSEDFVANVQAAIAANVDLGSREHANVIESSIECPHGLELFEQAGFVDAASGQEVPGMIGDRDVFQA